MRRRIYSLLHIFTNFFVEVRCEAGFFTVFFLSASALWLIFAVFLLSAAEAGSCPLFYASVYVPEMARAARLSALLSVCGGAVFDIQLRGHSDP